MFKAFGNHRLILSRGDQVVVNKQHKYRLVFMTKYGRVFRLAPGEFDIDHKFVDTDMRYRPYRQAIVWGGPITFVNWSQTRPGLGLLPVLRERYVDRLHGQHDKAKFRLTLLESAGAKAWDMHKARLAVDRIKFRIDMLTKGVPGPASWS